MNILRTGIPALAFVIACSPSVAQEPPDPFDALPYRPPQQLQQLVDLDDAQFQSLISENDGTNFRAIVANFDPPGSPIFPISHGFAGVRETCLTSSIVVACRLYLTDLLTIYREKEKGASVTTNPFGTPMR